MHLVILHFPTDLSFTYARDVLAAEIILVFILAGLEFVRLFLGRALLLFTEAVLSDKYSWFSHSIVLYHWCERKIGLVSGHCWINELCENTDVCMLLVYFCLWFLRRFRVLRCLSLFLSFFLQVIRAIWQKTKLQSFYLLFSQCHLFSVHCISCYGKLMYCVLMSSSLQSRLSSLAWK